MKLSVFENICSFFLREEDADVEELYKRFANSSIDVVNFQGIYHRHSQVLYRKRISLFLKMHSRTPLEWFMIFLSNVGCCSGSGSGGGGDCVGDCRKDCVDSIAKPNTLNKDAKTKNTDGIIIKMAKELNNIPSCYLARLVIRGYVESLRPKREVLKDVDELEEDFQHLLLKEKKLLGKPKEDDDQNETTELNPQQLSPSKLYKTPSLIPLKVLELNVLMCHKEDRHCSPRMDKYRTEVGLEYEEILEENLKKNNIPFMNEGDMRKTGYAKTPDSILLQPIAISRKGGEPLVVKWIESKAWFGDPTSHQTYLRDQYWPYYNRFGPGLVIYWMGIVDEMILPHHDKGVAVMDHFPLSENIIRIESTLDV